jgi:hypothetical protein
MVYPNRKIRNKERCAFRGKKVRYAVWRSEYNKHWELVHERLVRQLCADYKLNVEEHMVHDERVPWEHTWDKLKKQYWPMSRSIKDIQTEVEKEVGTDLGQKLLREAE